MRRVQTLSVTEPGRRLAEQLPFPHRHGDPARALASAWDEVDGLVVFLAVGATVRLLAPLLRSKHSDPAVVCVDDAGRFAVVVCGGHRGGGNALAQRVGGLLGATPVLTTASDQLGLPSLDQLPGLRAEGELAAAGSRLLAGDRAVVLNELGWPLPDALARLAIENPLTAGAAPVLVVGDRLASPAALARPPLGSNGRPVVWLRPPSLVVGIGTTSTARAEEAVAAVTDTLEMAGLSPAAVGKVATVDRRRGHPALEAVSEHLGAPVCSFSSEALDHVPVPGPSEVVRRAVGTASVAEAAALLAAGPEARLAVPKSVHGEVTVAVARRRGPEGLVSVVGLGPGHPAHRTAAAERAIRHAEVVVGFRGYLDQCRDLLQPGQSVLPFELGEEIVRVREALAQGARGRRVALVCSGDPGVFAMASPLLEEAGAPSDGEDRPFAGVPVEVVPGVTASLAAAAALGAPLGHDHAVVSLSDLHTPWEQIEARVAAAAAADFVLVLYNPRSRRRTWQLEKVKAMLLEHRSPDTPVGVVSDATRTAARTILTTLGRLPCEQVDMTTCVIVGATTTTVREGRMVTPRGYDR
jgi:cobalt-precorrin 5A hydrolase/precorrin-3B C17-methyltransferase